MFVFSFMGFFHVVFALWFCFVLFFPKSIHVLLFIFYNNILEAGNQLLIQRASCSFLLSNIDFWFSPPSIFLILLVLQGTSQHSFRLFYARLINDAIICHQHSSKTRFFRKTCQHKEHNLCSSAAIGHKCNGSIHKLWLLFACFSLSWQQDNS